MSVTPWLRSPLTDLTGNLLTHQWYGRCAELEMNLMECLEAYGKERGTQKCKDYIQDFKECSNRELQTRRAMAMRYERQRQYYTGERKEADRYAPAPPPESY